MWDLSYIFWRAKKFTDVWHYCVIFRLLGNVDYVVGWVAVDCPLFIVNFLSLILSNTHETLLPTATIQLMQPQIQQMHQIPSLAVRIGSKTVQPVSAVHDLGIMLDAEVTMSTHVSAVIKASFMALRWIGNMRRSILRHALLTLIQALVVSKVDYCNSVLAGVSDTLLRQLQSILNAAAWLVFLARKSEHITLLLYELHSLRVPERIKFWLCVLAFRCLHGTAPRYLAQTLHLTTSRIFPAVACTLLPRRHWSFQLRDDGPSVTMRFQLQLPVPGTLSSFVRDQQSLAAFRQHLKTVLFRTSFGEDANTWAASLLTRDCLVFLRWPCNVLCVIMPP